MTELTTLDSAIKSISLTTDDLINKSDIFMQITTRAANTNSHALVEFKTMTDEKLKMIAERMPEIDRATVAFGKQNSQTTTKLMSLTMIAASATHRLKQCLAQIERKRAALKENIFKLRKEKIELDKKIYLRDLLLNKDRDVDEEFDLRLLEIEIEEKVSSISDSNIYIEACLKEIGSIQDAYDEICKNNNIPPDWDEKYYEEAEIGEHIRMSFLHGVRDFLMTGRLNVGTCEYFEQYGINPVAASIFIQNYFKVCDKMIENQGVPDIETLYCFLDDMYSKFKDEVAKVTKRIGLDKIISDDFLYRTVT